MDEQVQEVDGIPAETVYVKIGENNPVIVTEHGHSEFHHVEEVGMVSEAHTQPVTVTEHGHSEFHHVEEVGMVSEAHTQEEQVPVVYRGYPQEIVHMIQETQTVAGVHTEAVVEGGGEEEVMMIIIDEGQLDPTTGEIRHNSGVSNIDGIPVVPNYQTTEAGDAVGQSQAAAPTANVDVYKQGSTDSASMLYCAEEDITEGSLDQGDQSPEDTVVETDKVVTGDILAKSLQCSGVNLAENTAGEDELMDEEHSAGVVGNISGETDNNSAITSKESDVLGTNSTVKEGNTANSTKSDSVEKVEIVATKVEISSKDKQKSSDNKSSESNDAAKFPFVCGLCSEKYSDLGLYYEHFKTHAESEKFLQSSKKHEVMDALNENGNKEQNKQNTNADESDDVDSSDNTVDNMPKKKSRTEVSQTRPESKAKTDSLARSYGTRGAAKSNDKILVKESTKNKNKSDPKSPSKEQGQSSTAEDEKVEGVRTRSLRGNTEGSKLSQPVHKGRKSKVIDEEATPLQKADTKPSNQKAATISDDQLPTRKTRNQLKRSNSVEEEQQESKKQKKESTVETNSLQTASPSRTTRRSKQSVTPGIKDVPKEKDSEPPVSTYKTRTGRTISTPSKREDSNEGGKGKDQNVKIKEVETEVNEDMNETKEPKRRGRKPKSQDKTDVDNSDNTLKENQQHEEVPGTPDVKHRYGTRRSQGIVKKQRVDEDFTYEHPYFTNESKIPTPDTTPKKDLMKGNESDKKPRRGRPPKRKEENDINQQQSEPDDIDEGTSGTQEVKPVSDTKQVGDTDRNDEKESVELSDEDDDIMEMEIIFEEPVKDTDDPLKSNLKNDTCTDEEADDAKEETVDSEVDNIDEINTDDKYSPAEESENDLSIDEKKTGSKKKGKYQPRRKRKKNGPLLYSCEECGKEMTKKGIKRHMTMHRDSRDYVCDDCGRSYKCQNHLTDHKKRHCKRVLSTRPYVRKIKLEEVDYDEYFADVLNVKKALKYVINKKVVGSDEDAEDIKQEEGTDPESDNALSNAHDSAEEGVKQDPDDMDEDIAIIKLNSVEVDADKVLEQNESIATDENAQMEEDDGVENSDGISPQNEETVADECKSKENNAISSSKQQSIESEKDTNKNEGNSEDTTKSTNDQEIDDEMNRKMVQAAAEILHSIRNNGEKAEVETPEVPTSDLEEENETGIEVKIDMSNEIEAGSGDNIDPTDGIDLSKEIELNENGVSQMYTGTTRYVQCRKCERILPRRMMAKHRVSHLKSRNFKCEICSKTYKSKAHLKDHIRSVHAENKGEKKAKCKLCLKELKNEKSLEQHYMLLHKVQKEDISDVSLDHDYEQKVESGADGIETDLDVKSEVTDDGDDDDDDKDSDEQKFPCKLCGKHFKKYALQRHMLVHKMNKDHICDICQAEFKSRQQLFEHKKGVHVEGKKFICNICQAAFKTSKTLWMHKTAHLNKDDPYYSDEVVLKLQEEAGGKRRGFGSAKLVQCEVCGKNVLSKRMVRHMTTHKSSRDYSCSICKKTFVALRYVKDHILKVHRATKCMCDICGQYFKGKQYVEKHRQTHGPRDKKCPLCDKCFTTEFYLKTHLQTHKEYKKSYVCGSCDAVFSHKPRLDIHILEHHTEREPDRPCKYCGVCFLSRQKARMHERKVHEGFKEGKHRVRKNSRSSKRPQLMGMDLDGTTTVMIKQEDLSQGQEVYVQDGTFLQVSDATGEESEQIEQVLEIPANAEQCQILLYPDGSFKVLNMTDPEDAVIEAE